MGPRRRVEGTPSCSQTSTLRLTNTHLPRDGKKNKKYQILILRALTLSSNMYVRMIRSRAEVQQNSYIVYSLERRVVPTTVFIHSCCSVMCLAQLPHVYKLPYLAPCSRAVSISKEVYFRPSGTRLICLDEICIRFDCPASRLLINGIEVPSPRNHDTPGEQVVRR